MLRVAGHKGMTLAIDAAGHSQNPPVIFLHGGGQTRHAWGEALQVLAEQNYFAVTADLRGHGDSDWDPNGDYTLASFAGDVTELCRHFAQKPILVGASMGGLSALLAVANCPEIAKALILVDIVPKVNMEGAMQIRDFMIANSDGFASLEAAAAAIADYTPHRKRTKNPEGLKKNLRLKEDGRYYWHWDPAFMSMENASNPFTDLEQKLRHVTMPTLLVRGEKSDIVDDEGVAHFREILPQAQYVKVAGAAHMIAGDSNQQFNQVVLDFLQHCFAND